MAKSQKPLPNLCQAVLKRLASRWTSFMARIYPKNLSLLATGLVLILCHENAWALH
jgi:hypothetical protein